LFQPDGRFGLVDFGCVKRVNFDIRELRRFYETRGWRENEAAERRFLSMVYGKGVPHTRARKILPLMEEYLDIWRPQGGKDHVIDFRNSPGKNPRLREIRRKIRRRQLQDKLINPDFIYLMRGDMGFWHLLSEIRATVNVSEISRRVAAIPQPAR
jgi:hypothetical protein